ncbi:hypothetical protein H8R23_09315 [Flavobacterium sp. F-380]|uniref:Membrane-anchored protein n=1 Tax=Flavobacterium kayseriense TaxID=2764714 RepID=A0ABR7J7U8_9FLAO|nr:hypothetical protein [Flavobacterium kayseriense]MBC5841605.1 hypothetical protein [Flavobacterium kayseriense]MBC5848133.1 hypothetical protein [Flavobacterium kayseriense]MBU0942304.1 hypothetical protein [Bacteroidota bacterium]
MKHLPKINLFYWALIISANTMGETVGDLISQTFGLGYGGGTIALLVLFLIALTISIYSKSQKPLLYWTVITLASTLGTTISDFISRSFFHLQLGFTENQGYLFGTIILIVALIATFGIWKYQSRTNTIENGLDKQTEFLYWIAILTSSTLGTAFGDLLAHNTPLGFDGGTLLLVILLAAVVGLYFLTKLSRELLYWFAIILTHPIGATMGDYLTKPQGFNLGNIKASLVLVVVFIIVIATGQLTKNRQTN